MKKLFKILAVLAVIIAVAVGAGFYFTAELPRVAERFFIAAKADDMDAAEGTLSAAFKSATPREALRSYLRSNNLSSYSAASWGNRSISGSNGTLQGSITTSQGEIPVTISFVKDADSWKIQHIKIPPSGVDTSSQTLPIPSDAKLIVLVEETMKTLAESVNTGTMQPLYDAASAKMRSLHSMEQLDGAFSKFYDQGDFLLLFQSSPTFTEKPVLKDGYLAIEGNYSTDQYKTDYFLQYFPEGGAWKLLGISIDFKSIEQEGAVAEEPAAQ